MRDHGSDVSQLKQKIEQLQQENQELKAIIRNLNFRRQRLVVLVFGMSIAGWLVLYVCSQN
jgi:cell division protein FtsB